MKGLARWVADALAFYLAIYLVDSLISPRLHVDAVWIAVVLAVLLALARLSGMVGFVTADLLGWSAPRILEAEEIINPSLHAAAVTLPALAAGIHGFLGTADFEGSVLRSGGIAPQLGRLAALPDWHEACG